MRNFFLSLCGVALIAAAFLLHGDSSEPQSVYARPVSNVSRAVTARQYLVECDLRDSFCYSAAGVIRNRDEIPGLTRDAVVRKFEQHADEFLNLLSEDIALDLSQQDWSDLLVLRRHDGSISDERSRELSGRVASCSTLWLHKGRKAGRIVGQKIRVELNKTGYAMTN